MNVCAYCDHLSGTCVCVSVSMSVSVCAYVCESGARVRVCCVRACACGACVRACASECVRVSSAVSRVIILILVAPSNHKTWWKTPRTQRC